MLAVDQAVLSARALVWYPFGCVLDYCAAAAAAAAAVFAFPSGGEAERCHVSLCVLQEKQNSQLWTMPSLMHQLNYPSMAQTLTNRKGMKERSQDLHELWHNQPNCHEPPK